MTTDTVARDKTTLPVRLLHLGRVSPRIMMTVLAVVVGLLGGAGTVAFHWLVDHIHELSESSSVFLPLVFRSWWVVLSPAIGGLIVGLLVKFLLNGDKGHGVAGVIESVDMHGGRLDVVKALLRVVAASITLGSGGSAGPEDPSVQVGAAAGSGIAQLLHLPDRRAAILVGCGAAAGIASAFNAPIAGAFFALEIILGEFTTGSFGMVVLSAVTSAALTEAVAGNHPTFQIPAYSFKSYWEFLFYIGLGVLAAIVSILYIKTLVWSSDYLRKWKAPIWLKPAIGGLFVGIIGYKLPQIYSVGYGAMESVLLQRVSWPIMLLVAILLAKMIATGVTLGSGGIGGVFAPSLFLGAMLGAAYGAALNRFLPGLSSSPAAYALVGMAAVLAGSVRSPITATLLLFEMTRDYHIILPLMFSTVISLIISEAMSRDSIYTLELKKHGVWLWPKEHVDVTQTVLVEEIMSPAKDVVPEDMPATELEHYLERTKHHGVPVVDREGLLVGVVSLSDVTRAMRKRGSLERLRVIDIATKNPITVYPDDYVWKALKLMSIHDIGRIPVVSRENPRKLVGIVRRQDVIKAYRLAIQRRQEEEETVDTLRLAHLSHTVPLRLVVGPNSPAAGKRVKDLNLPKGCVLTAIHRGNELIMVHGDVVLYPGDVITAVSTPDSMSELKKLFAEEEIIKEPRISTPFE